MSKRLVALPLFAVLLSLSACRDDETALPPTPPGDARTLVDTSIYDLQSNLVPVDAPVSLLGVVVVAIDQFGQRKGPIFVAEPEGGPFSGVYVFLTGTEAVNLQVGNLVDIVGGVKKEFALTSDDSGGTLTQVAAGQGQKIEITVVGDGVVPAPVTLNPWDLADPAEAEKWEGVLIRFDSVRVLTAPRPQDLDDRRRMVVTGPFEAQSSLTAFDNIPDARCYASVTGIGDYFVTYKITPRVKTDLVIAQSDTCLPLEQGAQLCSDTLDNDRSGTIDCGQKECGPSCPRSVAELQNGTVPKEHWVTLENVLVVARNKTGNQIWVQADGVAPGPHNGIQVFNGASRKFPPEVKRGARIRSVIGRTNEFDFDNDSNNTVTQLSDLSLGQVVAEQAAVEVVATPSLEEALTEPFEGVLVKLEKMNVAALGEAGRFTVRRGDIAIQVDADVFEGPTPKVGDCVTLTGPMTYNSFSNVVAHVARDVAVLAPEECN